MDVLIVESNVDLAAIWAGHLQRNGARVVHAVTEQQAVAGIEKRTFNVIILNLMLAQGSAMAVADYARFRHPETNVIFVTDTAFFSDGSIFALMPNARAYIDSATPPEDLAAMVEHFGRAA